MRHSFLYDFSETIQIQNIVLIEKNKIALLVSFVKTYTYLYKVQNINTVFYYHPYLWKRSHLTKNILSYLTRYFSRLYLVTTMTYDGYTK